MEGFAKIAKPLHELTKKNRPFSWTEKQQKAFEELKARLISYPVLATPLPTGKYVVDTDASNFALGAILQQEQAGTLRVIAYASRVLDSAEQSYCTTRKELLGVMFGLRIFRHYLLANHFLLRTDHAALTSLLRSPEPIGQQARWLDTLAEYNFEIKHRAGSQHNNSDSLSRRPCGSRKCTRPDCLITNCQNCENSNESENSELKNLTKNRSMNIEGGNEITDCSDGKLKTESKQPTHGLSLSILREAQEKDPVLVKVIMLLKEDDQRSNVDEFGIGVVHLWSQRQSLVIAEGILHRNFVRADGSILYQQALVPRSLRATFLHWVHDDPSSGHFGISKTQEKLQRYAYWSGWRKDVELYVRRCDVCCRYNKGPRHHQGLLQNGIGLSPMQKFHVDLTGPHPRSRKGNVYLLTGICSFTKYLITVPLRDKSALSVAHALLHHVFLLHGSVELQIHDQGKEFCNDVMYNLSRMLGVQDLRTTAYRPSANAAIERVHRTINAVFAKTVSKNLRDWCEVAPFVTFAYNASRHTSTTFTPFYLMYLREPRVGIDLLLDREEPAYQEFDEYSEKAKERMQIAFQIVEEQLKFTFDRAKRRYDSRVKAVQFKVGDFCYFYSPRIAPGRGRKFRNQTTGPWKVVKQINDVNYAIAKSPSGKSIIVHVDRLMKYFGELPSIWKTKNSVCGDQPEPENKKEPVVGIKPVNSGSNIREERDRTGAALVPVESEVCMPVQRPRRLIKPCRNNEFNYYALTTSRNPRQLFKKRAQDKYSIRVLTSNVPHRQKNSMFCQLCGERYETKQGLRRHSRYVHLVKWCASGQLLALSAAELDRMGSDRRRNQLHGGKKKKKKL